MVKHGYKVSGAQCLSKFSGLKRTYKAVKDYNKRYGSGSRTWTFFPVSYFKIKMLHIQYFYRNINFKLDVL